MRHLRLTTYTAMPLRELAGLSPISQRLAALAALSSDLETRRIPFGRCEGQDALCLPPCFDAASLSSSCLSRVLVCNQRVMPQWSVPVRRHGVRKSRLVLGSVTEWDLEEAAAWVYSSDAPELTSGSKILRCDACKH